MKLIWFFLIVCFFACSANGAFKAKVVYKCKESGSVAITFDDGPFDFTNSLLDRLKKLKVKATFFINGNNFGCIYDYADVLIRAKKEGHQIASHTWSHQDLAKLNKGQITYQVKKLEEAMLKILGVVPKFIRLPFGSGDNKELVVNTLTDLGYTIIQWDIDSGDSQGLSTTASLNLYKKSAGPPSSHIFLNHDTIKSTATNLAPKAFQIMKDRKFKIRTVGECLGVTDPSKWYKVNKTPQKRDKTWVCSNSDILGSAK